MGYIKVYRFEARRDAQAPWTGVYQATSMGWRVKSHCPSNGCPGPYDDHVLMNRLKAKDLRLRQMRFGFISIEQLRIWIWDEEVDNLFSKGKHHKRFSSFRPKGETSFVVYEVPQEDVVFSGYQCVFKMENAREIHRYHTMRQVKTVLGIYKQPINRQGEV